MPIITLTSDLGNISPYVSMVKGQILKELELVHFVDISHEVVAYNTFEASFIIKQAVQNFPDNTIHLIMVNTLDSSTMRYLAIYINKQYFIAPDNGIFSLIFSTEPNEIIEIGNIENELNNTFPIGSIFSKAACALANGAKLSDIGKPISTYKKSLVLQPVIQMNSIKGSVVYIDTFGNVVLNVSKQLFEEQRSDKNYIISFGSSYTIKNISNNYFDVAEGEILCLFNSLSLLEIAMNKGNAAQLLGLEINNTIQIDFI